MVSGSLVVAISAAEREIDVKHNFGVLLSQSRQTKKYLFNLFNECLFDTVCRSDELGCSLSSKWKLLERTWKVNLLHEQVCIVVAVVMPPKAGQLTQMKIIAVQKFHHTCLC